MSAARKNATGQSQLSIPLSKVKGIDLGGRGGNDTIEITQSAAFRGPIRAFGEDGDDRIIVKLFTNQSANITVDGGKGRDTCDIPDLQGKAGTFWTNAESGSFNSYAGWNTNKSSRATPLITSEAANRSPGVSWL